ncbi:MAG: NACHT domain-containing protein [Leptolyngbya sp. SIO1E4]|nr:NACHT domain-containing protein [Leptolyngbya sp. SIO1E4]
MTGFEPLIGAATSGLTDLIKNIIEEQGSEWLKQADSDLGRNSTFNQAVRKYVQRSANRYGIVKVVCVGMNPPVKLEEIYTAVQLLPRPALRDDQSPQSLQAMFRESGRRGLNFQQTEKKQGLEVANQQQYLMVLGDPNVGKSIFLRKMGLEALRRIAIMEFPWQLPQALKPQKNYYVHECMPVMLECRQFSPRTLKIEAVIADEFKACGFPKPDEFTELLLKSGKLLILLDGLDEVPAEAFRYTITQVETLVDRYPDNRFIACCRTAAYRSRGVKRFKNMVVATFEGPQIERFIQNWFQKSQDIETDTAKRCWELLNSPDYKAARELAQTPLLLTLLCGFYEEFQDFPKKRHRIYGEALDVLLYQWAAEQRMQKGFMYQKFGADLELELLSEIAYTRFVDDQLFFPKQAILDQIRDFQGDIEDSPNLDANKVLQEIEVQQGILVERARDTYSFSHLTFQEYLTAKYIVDNQKVAQIVRANLTDERWREVFLLVAGLMPGKGGADDLLRSMEQSAQRFLTGETTRDLVAWADAATHNSPGQAKSAAKRTAALALALDLSRTRARTRALARARALDLARARALDHARARAFDHALARALDRPLAHAIDRARALDRARVLERAREYQRLGIFQPEEAERLIHTLETFQAQISGQEDPNKMQRNLANSIIKIWFNAINLNPDYLDLSKSEIDALENYFYALELMIRCKEAAVRVSLQVWGVIESRILTIPAN